MDTKFKTKKIALILVFILIGNFAFPIYSHAAGGPLFKPITQLICGVGDLCLMTLQKVFLGYAIIQVNDNYRIYYSPLNIFSGNIPALDINFIKEKEYNKKITIQERVAAESVLNSVSTINSQLVREITYTGNLFITKNNSIKTLKKDYGYDSVLDITDEAAQIGIDGYGLGGSLEVAWYSEEDNAVYAIIDNVESKYEVGLNGSATSSVTKKVILYKYTAQIDPNTANSFSDSITVSEKEFEVTKTSAPQILGEQVSIWYNALKTVSLVGLLSVLVYIGIRMLISGVSEDKAKYKKMFASWIVALCLIFVLQYMMILIVQVSEDLVGIISKSRQEEMLPQDEFLNGIRNTLEGDHSFKSTFGLLIMYVVLVIFIVMFTITYVRRVIYIAFLTIIAPLVALTYPLDKVKDGKAQAFTVWLREYIFNSLLQVIHLLLYTILVSSAMDLAMEQPLYGVVAIGFILPAEKFFRKMFGFEKAQTISKVGVFVKSAALMNAMNKLRTIAKKKSDGEEIKKDDIKFSNNNKDTVEGKTGEKAGEAAGGVTGKASGSATGAGIGALVGSIVPGAGTAVGKEVGQEIGSKIGEEAGKKAGGAAGKAVGNAVGKVRKKITEKVKKAAQKKLVKGAKRFVKKKFKGKKVAKKLATKAMQVAGGATLGTIALAAGIATGSPENALKYGLAGIGAGSALGKGVVNKVDSGIKNAKENVETFKQGYLGTDYDAYSAEKANKEFMKDVENEIFFSNKFEDYKQAMNDALILRNSGITDNSEIAKALKMAYEINPNASEQERIQNVQKMSYIAGLDKVVPDDSYKDKETREALEGQIADRLKREAELVTTKAIDSDKVKAEAKNAIELLGKYKGII